ncbi:hypothetical protein RFI_31582, partial [Reticulomyxa filosa]
HNAFEFKPSQIILEERGILNESTFTVSLENFPSQSKYYVEIPQEHISEFMEMYRDLINQYRRNNDHWNLLLPRRVCISSFAPLSHRNYWNRLYKDLEIMQNVHSEDSATKAKKACADLEWIDADFQIEYILDIGFGKGSLLKSFVRHLQPCYVFAIDASTDIFHECVHKTLIGDLIREMEGKRSKNGPNWPDILHWNKQNGSKNKRPFHLIMQNMDIIQWLKTYRFGSTEKRYDISQIENRNQIQCKLCQKRIKKLDELKNGKFGTHNLKDNLRLYCQADTEIWRNNNNIVSKFEICSYCFSFPKSPFATDNISSILASATNTKIQNNEQCELCVNQNVKNITFDLAICYDLALYLNDKDLKFVLKELSYKAKYLYFDVPLPNDYNQAKQDYNWTDPYAIIRTEVEYENMLSEHFIPKKRTCLYRSKYI